MSRESTPGSLIGRLAITGSPGSSGSDMPVTTRGMQQRDRNVAASHQASTSTAAGPSRSTASVSRRQAARSGGQTARRSARARRSKTTQPEDEDDSDGNADGSDYGDESGDDDAGRIVNEIMSTFADTHPSPHEFSRVDAGNGRTTMGSEQTRDCRRLAAILAGAVARDPDVLTVLRQQYSRTYCAARLVNNLWARDATIMRELQTNLADQANGRDVPYAIEDWRDLNLAIESVLTGFWADLTQARREMLASLLISILDRIFGTDRDLYVGRNRTVYAGESSGGNLFRRFISGRANPIDFLGPLQRLDGDLLATQTDNLRDTINQYITNGPAGSDQEQYNRVMQSLRGIWSRATGQQI